MAQTETTTTCQTVGCDREQEQGLRTFDGFDYRLCVPHATDLYDALDYNRRGGKVTLFEI